MKIVKIEMFQIDFPLKSGGYKMSMGKLEKLDSTVVAITTDTGITGYGESCPVGSAYQPEFPQGQRQAIELMTPYLIGQNPLHFEVVNDVMNAVLDGHNSSKSAIDIALWDIAGKHYNQPIYTLLGGAKSEKVVSYYSVSMCPVDEIPELVKEKKAQGFSRWQVKLGGENIEENVARVRKTIESIDSNDRLYGDANRGWTADQTIRFSKALSDVEMGIEQPCRTYEENKKVAPQLNHPMLLDENMTSVNEVIRAISDGFVIGFGMKMSRVGGMTNMRIVRDLCLKSGLIMSSDDTWGGDIISMANAHMGKTIPMKNFRGSWVSAPYHDIRYSDDYDGIVDGIIPVSNKAGLGLDIKKEKLGKAIKEFG